MKFLHMMRHAKSSWNETGLSDRARGLNKRGRRDAPRMGQALSQRIAPVPVTVSPARRARLTLEGLCEGWPALGDFHHAIDEQLYTFSAEDLVAWLWDRDDVEQSLFIIGHNPAFTDLANFLVADFELVNLPTAGYLQLALRIDHWRDMGQCCAAVELSLFPRQL